MDLAFALPYTVTYALCHFISLRVRDVKTDPTGIPVYEYQFGEALKEHGTFIVDQISFANI